MAANLYSHQASNVQKTWLLMAIFLVLVIALGWVISYVFGEPLILWVAVAFSIVMNVFSYWYSDKLVVKLTGAVPAPDEQYPDLHNVVENLVITAGLPKPKIYIINDSAPNALATGRDPNHAAVAVTTGLLAILNRTELEGVIAHELSHIGNRDILISTVAVVLAGFVSILADIFLRSRWYGGGHGDRRNNAGAVLVIAGLVLAILAPIFATLIQFAISRRREFLADASGALLTRYPEGLASALEKIAAVGQPMRRASQATAHLFIANPFAGRGFSLTHLFMTHPPVEARVRALRQS
ncbi:MAG: M48 family metalloprotease [Patescibacteria group bacterium]